MHFVFKIIAVMPIIFFTREVHAQEKFKACYETSPHSSVVSVEKIEDDATVVLSSNQRIVLIGSEIVVDKEVGESEAEKTNISSSAINKPSCAKLGVDYLKARVKQVDVRVYPQHITVMDKKFRIPSFLLTEKGEFLNKDLLRHGFAKLRTDYERIEEIDCLEEFEQAQAYAKKKKLGIWGGNCRDD